MKEALGGVFAQASKLKLTGGLVGRVCSVVVFASISLAVIGFSSRSEWISGAAILAIVLIAVPAMWRVMNFAFAHPKIATLDGAEMIQMETLANKSSPHGIPGPTANVAESPLVLDAHDAALVNVPDASTTAGTSASATQPE